MALIICPAKSFGFLKTRLQKRFIAILTLFGATFGVDCYRRMTLTSPRAAAAGD